MQTRGVWEKRGGEEEKGCGVPGRVPDEPLTEAGESGACGHSGRWAGGGRGRWLLIASVFYMKQEASPASGSNLTSKLLPISVHPWGPP